MTHQTDTSPPARRWLKPLAGFAILFGAMTLFSGGSVLFGPAASHTWAGNYIGFVVWFNFGAGAAYIVAGHRTVARQTVGRTPCRVDCHRHRHRRGRIRNRGDARHPVRDAHSRRVGRPLCLLGHNRIPRETGAAPVTQTRKSSPDRKAEILATTLDLAFEVGPDHVTTGRIAARLG